MSTAATSPPMRRITPPRRARPSEPPAAPPPAGGAVPAGDLDRIRAVLVDRGERADPSSVAAIMRTEGMVVSDASLAATVETLRQQSVGAGPLDPLLRSDGVTDVVVNGPDQVFVDRGDGLELSAVRFGSDDEVRRLAQRLAASVGRRLDDSVPFVDARLSDGTRVHAVLGVLADRGTCLSLRVPARRTFSLDEYEARGSIGSGGARLLRRMIARRVPFLVSGGTGSGKTTLLAALLGLVPACDRIVVVEDSRELAPAHPHVLRLEGRPPNAEGAGAVTLTDLVRQSLRMRPDRVVVGEVRGAEICDLLAAMNTGHEGGCGTVHANSAGDVPARLEALAALGGMSRAALHAQLASALSAVVHVRRERDGQRRVAEIAVLVRDPGSGLVESRTAVAFDRDGTSRLGPGAARLDEVLR
ncbi:pilus assembly protein CpaF [Friedmanniella endophytica]|uniref:Pilus assembly protein CpaF n=1 Tax=Microlunatus kandeliicorticis TaxID=1759536 RepID=A0A7W3IRR8_9ACTN|nr:TadA family conjugal transfer-associated ATPase [Microlunatus kandeliicorticis]MBA8794000.1 pilus assembly protein CpaF [Microlunatus kandeliicorticis]